MRTPMDIAVDEDFSAAGEPTGRQAPCGREAKSKPAAGAPAGERAQAAMALFETYVAGYRAWALNLRRPTN